MGLLFSANSHGNKEVDNSALDRIIDILEILRSLSGNDLLEKLEFYKCNLLLKEILYYTYNPHMTYKIKESKLQKFDSLLDYKNINSCFPYWQTFKDIITRLSMQKAAKESDIKEIYESVFTQIDDKYIKLFKGILFKDLRLGLSLTSFNKVWSDFSNEYELMLADDFKGDVFTKALFSRKLDGRRAYRKVEFFTRYNNKYNTVNIKHIIKDMEDFDPENLYVPDGEFIYIDASGKEDFSKTGILMKDDFTDLSKNIRYAIFYILDAAEFESGNYTKNFEELYKRSLELLGVTDLTDITNGLYKTKYPNIYLVAQFGNPYLKSLQEMSKQRGWEGLMMLDAAAKYQHKRTKFLQKIKEMQDAEFEIVEFGKSKAQYYRLPDGSVSKQQVIESSQEISLSECKKIDVLGYLTVKMSTENGCFLVDVGSGFTDAQRDELWKRRFEILNGKFYATVQYFEKTKDASGKESLRFPVFKGLRNATGEDL